MKKIIDLSLTLENNMPTCGTPWHQKVEIDSLGTSDSVGRNTSRIVLGSHSGTHMDAPAHFIPGGNTIDMLDVNMLCGPISVIDFTNKKDKIISKTDFEKVQLAERILLRFDWHRMWKTERYYKDFPYMTVEAGEYLIQQGVRMIAMDTPSPDSGMAIGEKDDSPVHKLFLKNGVIIVEYLTNTDMLCSDKKYEIIALPLKIMGSDGCPARVIARELN